MPGRVQRARAHLVHVAQLFVAGPVLLAGGAQHLPDLLHLLDLALAVEEHLLREQLRHDAAQRPHVNRCRVLLRACAVPHTHISTAVATRKKHKETLYCPALCVNDPAVSL